MLRCIGADSMIDLMKKANQLGITKNNVITIDYFNNTYFLVYEAKSE